MGHKSNEHKALDDLAAIAERHGLYEAGDTIAKSFFDPDGYKAHMDRAALLAHIREQAVRIDELSETWTDEAGSVWRPPTAWAYAKVCAVRAEQAAQLAANVAICDHETRCPCCNLEVTPRSVQSRWETAYGPIRRKERGYGSPAIAMRKPTPAEKRG